MSELHSVLVEYEDGSIRYYETRYVPEKTCEFESLIGGKKRCKRCGAFVSFDAVWDCCGVIPSRFCPNCGAKIKIT